VSADPTPVTVAVAPTLGTVVSVDVRYLKRITIQAQNMDATQTFSGYLTNKAARSMGAALSPVALSALLPAGSVDADGNPADCTTIDVDCGGFSDVALVGKMSGIGGNVKYVVRQAGPK
jgi:hypothetical protein